MPYLHFGQVRRNLCGQVVREEGDYLVGNLDTVFGNGKSDGGGCKGFAYGVQDVVLIGSVVAQPMFGHYFSVTQNHHAVKVLSAFLNRLQVVGDAFRVYLFGFGCAAGQCFGQLVVADQLYSFVADCLFHLVAGKEVGHPLAVGRHLLVSYMVYGFHFGIVQGGMIYK